MVKGVVLLLMIFLMCPASVFAYGEERGPVTLYVSTDGGSLGECMPEHPCRDIAQAMQFVLPGDTIVIREGDYQGFRLENVHATREKPLVIKGEGRVRIAPNNELRDARDNIEISNCDWITVDNIQSFDANRAGIRIDQSHHVTVRNSVFGNNTTWGIFANQSNDLVLENNDCYGSKKQHGIYYSNSGDRPLIRGNRVHGNAGAGIHLNGDLSSGEGREVPGDGIISGAVVENNIIFDNGKAGGAAVNCDGIHDAVIRNNLMFNNHAAGITLFLGDGASGAANVKVYNNTIDMAEDSRWAVVVKDSAGPVYIANNILINRRQGRGALAIGASESMPSVMERVGIIGTNKDLEHTYSDHNVFGGERGIATLNEGESRLSLGDWQKKQDRDSIFVPLDKLFIDPAHGNYHLSPESPAVGRGVVVPEVDQDIEGKVRSQGHGVDAGAYEGH